MKTEYPGVYRINETTYRIRFHYADVRDGKKKEGDRILSDVTVRQAAKTGERNGGTPSRIEANGPRSGSSRSSGSSSRSRA
jgi:hypothetical protein